MHQMPLDVDAKSTMESARFMTLGQVRAILADDNPPRIQSRAINLLEVAEAEHLYPKALFRLLLTYSPSLSLHLRQQREFFH